jgi:hypothetical protein
MTQSFAKIDAGVGLDARLWVDPGIDPTEVGLKQAFQRTMRIALCIGAGVMLDVGGSPADRIRMRGDGTQRQQTETHGWIRLKTPVSEHSMLANGDANPG